MSFLELAKKRYSVRRYKTQVVEKEKLDQVLEAGRVAPTGANQQPFKLIAVQGQEGLNKISKCGNIHGAPLAIIACSSKKQAWTRPFDGKNLADIDTTIATDHMMLEATELGLGTLWVCYFNPDELKKEFSIPDEFEPLHILAVGYSDDRPLSPDRHDETRKPMNDIVIFEK